MSIKIYSVLCYKNDKLYRTNVYDREDIEIIIKSELNLYRSKKVFTYDKCKIKFTNGMFKQKITKDYYLIVYDDNGDFWKKHEWPF